MSRAADRLQSHAELLKLAAMLDRTPEQLAYLDGLGPGDMRRLRTAITGALYDSQDGALGRLAAASRILPTGLTATIGQRAFGPLLSARLAGLLDPDRAVDVAGKMPPEFLADVAVELDPRRASEVISRLSPELIARVTQSLVAREEYVTMGQFVGHLTDGSLTAALAEMSDRDVLRVAFVMEEQSRLSAVLAKLPRPRLAGIIAAAAQDNLWLQALDLLNHLTARQRRDIVKATLALDPSDVDAVRDTIVEHELWDEALLISEHDPAIAEELGQRIAALPARQRRALAERGRDSAAFEQLALGAQAVSRT